MLALILTAYMTGTAPFCVVDQIGDSTCIYYTLDDCRDAAETLGGICAPNPNPQ